MEQVNIKIPKISEQKMKAISDLSAAVKELSKALASTHVEVSIANCNFTDTGVEIDLEED